MKVSTAQKVEIVARVAGRQLARTRTASAIWKGVRVAGTHLGRVLHQLWLEITGFTFLVLAGVGALAGVREYSKYEAGQPVAGRLAVAVCFTITFAWFGVSSFWRVRKRTSHQGH